MAYPKITKRKDGRFSAMVPVGRDENGKQIRKTVYGRTKGQVKQKIDELEEEIRNNTINPVKGSELTIAQWTDEYLDLFRNSVRMNTFKGFKYCLKNHVVPELGHIKLKDLTKREVQIWFNKIKDEGNLKNSTCNEVLRKFKRILNVAVEYGYINENPASSVKGLKVSGADIYPLDEDELRLFLDECKDTEYEYLFNFLVLTGLRIGETMALTWDDLKENTLTVSKQFYSLKGDTEFHPTKNGKTRTLALSQSALKVLEHQRRKQTELRFLGDRFFDNKLNLIFTDSCGDKLSRYLIHFEFKEIVNRIGCPNSRIHDLRHTFAILNLKAGVDPKTISEFLGHSSVEFTLNRYAYVTNDMKKEAADKLDNLLNSQNIVI